MRKLIIILIALMTLTSCALVQKMAMKQVSKMFAPSSSSGGAVDAFLMDDDPQLVKESLPTMMKALEMLALSSPEDDGILYTTGMIFVMYANAFIQTPAGMLSMNDFEEQQLMLKRAKKLYARGKGYLLQALDARHPGFTEALMNDRLEEALGMTTAEDAGMLYWCGAGWVSMFSCDPLDFQISTTSYRGASLVLRAYQLDENYSNGTLNDVIAQIYTSLPSMLITAMVKDPSLGEYFNTYYEQAGIGIDIRERAMYHFTKSIELSGGRNPAPYISMATSLAVKDQNLEQYEQYLEKALSIDPYGEGNEKNRLLIVIYRDKAQWLLEHKENYFILDEY